MSPSQRAWARVGGRDLVEDDSLKALQVHGPLVVHRVKVTSREHGLQRADLEHFRYPGGEELVELSTRCSPSEVGATAEAFDVAGFVLADGRRIRVLGDWNEDSAAARFLHDVRDGACRFFDGVLSPDHNAAHRDHLHLDRGTYRYCR